MVQHDDHTTPGEDYISFLLRYWYDPAERRWRGEIAHVQSGARGPVASLAEVNAFVLAHSREVQRAAQQGASAADHVEP